MNWIIGLLYGHLVLFTRVALAIATYSNSLPDPHRPLERRSYLLLWVLSYIQSLRA